MVRDERGGIKGVRNKCRRRKVSLMKAGKGSRYGRIYQGGQEGGKSQLNFKRVYPGQESSRSRRRERQYKIGE